MNVQKFLFILIFLGAAESCMAQKASDSVLNEKYTFFSIHELWRIDSCGNLNYRDSIGNYLWKSNYLIGRNKIFIQQLLGKPDNSLWDEKFNVENTQNSIYTFTVRCLHCIKDWENCEDTIDIIFDNNGKVKKVESPLH